MIEWLISFGNGCHYITMAFLLLYLLWLVRESFRTRKSGVVREEIMCSDDAGKCFLALWLAAEYLMRENFPFSLYPHYTAWKYWIAWPLLILCVIMEKSIKYRGFRIMIRRGISALFGKLDNARDFIERGSHGPQRWVILFILVIFGQSFVSIPDIAASPDLSKSIEFFVVLAISILYSLAAIYKAMYSATWLCITWFLEPSYLVLFFMMSFQAIFRHSASCKATVFFCIASLWLSLHSGGVLPFVGPRLARHYWHPL